MASDLGLHRLPMSHKKDARLIYYGLTPKEATAELATLSVVNLHLFADQHNLRPNISTVIHIIFFYLVLL